MNTISLAFAAGLVAAINPCGFALLPAYLSYYLGFAGTENRSGEQTGSKQTKTQMDQTQDRADIMRALKVSSAMTVGFVMVFGLIGVAWSAIGGAVGEHLPWVTAVLGLAVIIAGIAMLFGAQPVVHLPRYESKSGNADELASMFLFGVSYATASLSCTLPVFVALVSGTFRKESFFSGLAAFVAYALGMGAVVGVLTMAVAFARHGLIHRMRSWLKYVGRASGVLMICSGAFVTYYGWWEIRLRSNPSNNRGLGATVTRWQNEVSRWVSGVGEVRVGLVLILVLLSLAALTVARNKPTP
jgi:cytochrome c biogenesis protein CcdA